MQSKQDATKMAKDGMLCLVDMLSIKSGKGIPKYETGQCWPREEARGRIFLWGRKSSHPLMSSSQGLWVLLGAYRDKKMVLPSVSNTLYQISQFVYVYL